VASNNFFTNVAQERVEVAGITYNSPLFYHDFSFDAIIFRTPRGIVEKFLPSSEYVPIADFTGCALTALLLFEYRETEVNPYNEVALCIPLLAYGKKPNFPIFSILESFFRRSLHAHVVDLPVNTEPALRGGVDVIGYPKFIADITFSDENGKRSCEITDKKHQTRLMKITYENTKGLRLGSQKLTFHSYPVKEDKTLFTTFRLEFDSIRTCFIKPKINLSLGDGPFAEAASDLLQNPILTVSSKKGRGILYFPEVANA